MFNHFEACAYAFAFVNAVILPSFYWKIVIHAVKLISLLMTSQKLNFECDFDTSGIELNISDAFCACFLITT